jgi:hypothetical protein
MASRMRSLVAVAGMFVKIPAFWQARIVGSTVFAWPKELNKYVKIFTEAKIAPFELARDSLNPKFFVRAVCKSSTYSTCDRIKTKIYLKFDDFGANLANFDAIRTFSINVLTFEFFLQRLDGRLQWCHQLSTE